MTDRFSARGVSTPIGSSQQGIGLDRAAWLRRSSESSEVQRQRDFASVLARGNGRGSDPNATPEEAARESAQQFVALTLVQPLLKQLRETNNAAPPFAPSEGEKQFQSLLDAQVAQQVVRKTNFPLVDRVARDLLLHGRPASTEAAAPEGPHP